MSSTAAAPPPLPPPRVRKTHFTEKIVIALKKFPHMAKVKMNALKTERNLQRALAQAYHEADPTNTAHPRPSDVSSLITLTDEDHSDPQVAEAARTRNAYLATLSPTTGAAVSAAIGKKRTPEEPTEPIAKRMRKIDDQVVWVPGAAIVHGFSDQLTQIQNLNIYLPLSLFTNKALDYINRNRGTHKLNKVYGQNSDKSTKVVDIDDLTRILGKEEDLSPFLYAQAVRNRLRFEKEFDPKGELGTYYGYWDEYFGHWDSRPDLEDYFQAALNVDIRLRQDYITKPIAFNPIYYEELYTAEKIKFDIAGRNASAVHATQNHKATQERIGAPNTSSSSRTRDTTGNSNFNRGNGATQARPFREGNGGEASTPVCLICARRGHRIKDCSHTTFEDGAATPSTLRGNDIFVINGGKCICRHWNIKGDASGCFHGNKKAHCCTFCGANHFAFSWTCRKEPAGRK